MKIDSASSQNASRLAIEEEERRMAEQVEARRAAAQRDADRRVETAEVDAQSRIKAAQYYAHQTAQEAEAELNKLRSAYGEQMAAESARHERALMNERNKGEERVQRQVRQNNRELHRARRDYETYRSQLDEQHRTQAQATEVKGRREVADLVALNERERETVRTKGEQGVSMLKENYDREVRRLNDDLGQKQLAFQERSLAEQARLEETTLTNQRLSREQHEARYAENLARNRAAIAKVDAEAQDEALALRRANATEVNAYSSRLADPFYRMNELKTELKETDEGYILTAKIPKHEQKSVTVAVRDNTLVVSGTREAKEVDSKVPGETIETHSYQTFRKAHVLNVPVDPKRLKREFFGEELRVTVPKKTGPDALALRPYQAKTSPRKPS